MISHERNTQHNFNEHRLEPVSVTINGQTREAYRDEAGTVYMKPPDSESLLAIQEVIKINIPVEPKEEFDEWGRKIDPRVW